MLVIFTRQLYTLIKAGIPLLKAFQIIIAQLPVGKFKTSIESIANDIQGGKSLSEAISMHPKVFSAFYINMIKAAEISGNLVGILKELSAHLTQSKRLSRQVQAAFMYPVLILIVASIILIGLLVFVMPLFIRVFDELGGKLPLPTLILIGLSKFILQWGWLILVFIATSITGMMLFYQQPAGKYFFTSLIWRIPLFGRLAKTIDIARFSRTTGTLLSSGVTLIKTLEVASDTASTVILRDAIKDIQYEVEQGKTLSLAMEELKIFPLTLVRMIQVGEESGKIADLFLDAAEDYENEVGFAISGLLSLLEPALIVVMGAVVGFIVVSLFFPIFTISGLLR